MTSLEGDISRIDGVRESVVVLGESGEEKILNIAVSLEYPKDHCFLKIEVNKKIPGFLKVNEILFFDDIPKTPSGKYDYKKVEFMSRRLSNGS
ncbi:hypothetical protein V6259_08400 [Marinomonas sp. TI.3.20]|uniref:hypothetical protein n=1 Tax=Marinomonas sp. TI.3.20 TaxID=3121296 RepID=UPI00311F2DA1